MAENAADGKGDAHGAQIAAIDKAELAKAFASGDAATLERALAEVRERNEATAGQRRVEAAERSLVKAQEAVKAAELAVKHARADLAAEKKRAD